MPKTDRDAALVRHLAERVMGCTPDQIERWGLDPHWNPLDSWADAGMVWERARKMGIWIELSGADNWRATFDRAGGSYITLPCDSGPRAISEAVGRATGFEDVK